MTRVVRTVDEVRDFRQGLDAVGKTLALVPTMGFLHEGHLSLVREAKARADVCAVSIFVNPTQFGPDEDLASYPRDEEGDLTKLQNEEVGLVFAPTVETLYPEGEETRVEVTRLAERLCGASRPGHFQGVATVVLKLFNILEPTVAVFGEKDFQQLQVIRRMTRDLFLDIEIVGAPIVRGADGLALSSRNAYLSLDDRRKAVGLSKALQSMRGAAGAGIEDVANLLRLGRSVIERHGLTLDYLEVVDARSLQPLDRLDGRAARALVAAFCGKVRLIDNAALDDEIPLVG